MNKTLYLPTCNDLLQKSAYFKIFDGPSADFSAQFGDQRTHDGFNDGGESVEVCAQMDNLNECVDCSYAPVASKVKFLEQLFVMICSQGHAWWEYIYHSILTGWLVRFVRVEPPREIVQTVPHILG